MKDSSKYYLTDHYSWVKTETGTFICAHETADGLVYSVLSQDKHTLIEGNASYMEFKKNDKLVDSPSAAYIYRIQCPNLWNCIGTNIIRQVIRASQAKNMYRTFSESIGERVSLTGGIYYYLFPSPQKVLETPDSTYQRMGMTFKRDALKKAARFILEHTDRLEKILRKGGLASPRVAQGRGSVYPGAAQSGRSREYGQLNCYADNDSRNKKRLETNIHTLPH